MIEKNVQSPFDSLSFQEIGQVSVFTPRDTQESQIRTFRVVVDGLLDEGQKVSGAVFQTVANGGSLLQV